ncbi:conjugal transfer protein [Jeotgalibaca caeni]|uniref:conjugal transfer protein n=1 Tax=Jeotgalibaca caeni TaxID=3028623 RepID=UPI00237EDFA2|nr:conjugal transfer protein [Jeotgalibaca caeni]MDE1548533.1 conjugal transfer protein [Jeotgalibaca caeni]
MAKKGKEFIFADNVNASYGAFFGLNLKDLVSLVPSFILSLLLLAIPPYTLIFMGIKLFLFFLINVGAIAIKVSRPVKYRSNITLHRYLSFKKQYQNRQKLFYIRPVQKAGDGR